MSWAVELTPKAREMLIEISDRRIREKIAERIDALSSDPEKQGKPLVGELSMCYSLRAAGQRYRIIYKMARERKTVQVVALGIRRESDRQDIYALAKRLVQLGMTVRRRF